MIFNNGANTPTSTRNGQSLAGAGSFDEFLLVTATPVGANTTTFLSSISSTTVAPCACEFTQWGFWSALTGQSLDNGQSRFVDGTSVPALWVAGVPTAATNLPTTGTATYTGHAIADISYNGAQYLAAGTFANTVNFGTATGAVTINGLDGTNYAGNVSLTPSSTLFAGYLTGNVGGRSAAHERLVLPRRRDQYDPALRRDGRQFDDNGNELSRQRDFLGSQALSLHAEQV